MSGARAMLRAQARRQLETNKAERRAVQFHNRHVRADRAAELATMPEGWTSVQLEGAIQPVPFSTDTRRAERAKKKARGQPRRLGGMAR